MKPELSKANVLEPIHSTVRRTGYTSTDTIPLFFCPPCLTEKKTIYPLLIKLPKLYRMKNNGLDMGIVHEFKTFAIKGRFAMKLTCESSYLWLLTLTILLSLSLPLDSFGGIEEDVKELKERVDSIEKRQVKTAEGLREQLAYLERGPFRGRLQDGQDKGRRREDWRLHPRRGASPSSFRGSQTRTERTESMGHIQGTFS